VAIGLAGSWYEAIFDSAGGLWSLVPSGATVTQLLYAVSWPDWSVSWVTGPLGTGLLLLIWWRTRHGIGPLATSGKSDQLPETRPSYANQSRETLRKALTETEQDHERLRGLLGAAEEARRACKREFAEAKVKWFSARVEQNIERARREGKDLLDMHATVRFAVYTDLALAQAVVKILKELTGWAVEIDGSNKPTLMPSAKGFKVIFDVGPFRTFDQVASAFSEGELLGADVKVGVRITDHFDDQEHLIVEVLPVTP